MKRPPHLPPLPLGERGKVRGASCINTENLFKFMLEKLLGTI
jgi:hypothetical protein